MMKSRLKIWIKLPLLLAAVVFTVTACRTLEYRTVQSEFEQAVRADNEGTPFSRQHEDVVAQLTPEYIAKLDPKLRPNAWMLRAVSAWRAGMTNEPEQSAERGLAEANLVPGSRDDIVLRMIPALVVDSDLQRRWLASNRSVDEASYAATYEPGFKAAFNELKNSAEPAMNERTPVDARAYFHYQYWRLVFNWASVISSVKPMDAQFAAQDRATNFVGFPKLLDAAKAQCDQIPSDHPHRALIRAQGGE